jgi:hypothetical protein
MVHLYNGTMKKATPIIEQLPDHRVRVSAESYRRMGYLAQAVGINPARPAALMDMFAECIPDTSDVDLQLVRVNLTALLGLANPARSRRKVRTL